MADEATPEIYQFQVRIRRISPMIWRRLLIRADSTLANLHDAIQIAFGWSDFHLHRFRIHGWDYGVSRVGRLRPLSESNQGYLFTFPQGVSRPRAGTRFRLPAAAQRT